MQFKTIKPIPKELKLKLLQLKPIYRSLQLYTSRFTLFGLISRHQYPNPFYKYNYQRSFVNYYSIRVTVGKLLIDILINFSLLAQYGLGLITNRRSVYISFSLSFIINKRYSTRVQHNLRAQSISFNRHTILVNIVLAL